MKKADLLHQLTQELDLRDWQKHPYLGSDGQTYHTFRHQDTIRFFLLLRRLEHAIGWMQPDQNGQPRPGLAQSMEEIADFCTKLLQRVSDGTRCNDPCKMMYFCDRKKGHRGRHQENTGLSWEK